MNNTADINYFKDPLNGKTGETAFKEKLPSILESHEENINNIIGDLDTPITGVKARVTTLENNKANLDSPAFTGNPQAPTPTFGDNDTSIATSAFVQEVIGTIINVVGNNGGAPVVIPASKPIGYIYEIRKTGTTGQVNITLSDTNEKFTTSLLTQIYLNTDSDFWRIKKVSATRWDIIGGKCTGYTDEWNSFVMRYDGTFISTGMSSSGYTANTVKLILCLGTGFIVPIEKTQPTISIEPSALNDYNYYTYGGASDLNARFISQSTLANRVQATILGRWYK